MNEKWKIWQEFADENPLLAWRLSVAVLLLCAIVLNRLQPGNDSATFPPFPMLMVLGVPTIGFALRFSNEKRLKTLAPTLIKEIGALALVAALLSVVLVVLFCTGWSRSVDGQMTLVGLYIASLLLLILFGSIARRTKIALWSLGIGTVWPLLVIGTALFLPLWRWISSLGFSGS